MPDDAPKLFVSYSWANAEHQAWVIQVATDLRDNGIDVILDKWDLKEGQDAFAFMEQMVTSPDINKVIMICDAVYAEKADGRKGGVGAETQIITPRIYGSQDQSKFVAVIRERDRNGNAYVPAYFESRIYIDLSDPSTYDENFEQLVRWVYDKPLYAKPPLGKKPEYLTAETSLHIPTASACRRAISALKGGKSHASPAVKEYFELVAAELEKFRISVSEERPFDDDVIKSIDAFVPYRAELVTLFKTIADYGTEDQATGLVHDFFESVIPYLARPENVSSWKDWDFDNFKFIIHELFLTCMAVYIHAKRYSAAAFLMNTEYYVKNNEQYGRQLMVPYVIFWSPVKSLQYRNERLGLRRSSVRADILKERSSDVPGGFSSVMTADFVLFMRSLMSVNASGSHRWWPETLVYLGHFGRGLELFARAKSRRIFDQVKVLLNITKKEDLEPIIQGIAEQRIFVPNWNYEHLNVTALLGYDLLATAD